MDKVYVVIAENGSEGIYSVTTHSTLEEAQDSLSTVASQLIEIMGESEGWGTKGTKPRVELNERGGFVTNDSDIINLDIYETKIGNSFNMVIDR